MVENLKEAENPSSKKEDSHGSETAGAVLRDFVAGMYHEAKEHPGKLIAEAGVGAAITIGAVTMGPRVAIGAALVGTGLGVYEAGKGALNLGDQARIIENAGQKYSAEEIRQAHLNIRGMGASTMDALAVAAGGGAAFETTRLATNAALGYNGVIRAGIGAQALNESAIPVGLTSAARPYPLSTGPSLRTVVAPVGIETAIKDMTH